MVHQHFSLVEPLTVWENVALGDVGRLDPDAVAARVGEISEQYGLDVDPDARVADLPAGCASGSRSSSACAAIPILIFDEPTSVLTPAESEFLFDALRRSSSTRARPSHSSATSSTRSSRRPTTSPSCATARSSTMRRPQSATPPTRRAMVGREVSLRSERRPRCRRRRRSTHRGARDHPESAPVVLEIEASPSRPVTVVVCSTDSPSRSTPARSSVSPGSRATASDPSATCCRASSRSIRGGSSRRRADRHRPSGRDGAGGRRRHPRGPPRLGLRARLHGGREPRARRRAAPRRAPG